MTVENRIKKLVNLKTSIAVEKISLNDTFEDLDIDSLDKVELCMEIEKEFNLSIPDQELENFNTVGNFIDYLDVAVKHHQL